jgi:hypothetical protein
MQSSSGPNRNDGTRTNEGTLSGADLVDRKALRSSDPKAVQQGTDRLEEEIEETVGKQLPKAIDDDLDTVRRIVGFLQEDKANKFQAINADVYLRLTEYIFTAGRTDCHSMQVNVNNAVN